MIFLSKCMFSFVALYVALPVMTGFPFSTCCSHFLLVLPFSTKTKYSLLWWLSHALLSDVGMNVNCWFGVGLRSHLLQQVSVNSPHSHVDMYRLQWFCSKPRNHRDTHNTQTHDSPNALHKDTLSLTRISTIIAQGLKKCNNYVSTIQTVREVWKHSKDRKWYCSTK